MESNDIIGLLILVIIMLIFIIISMWLLQDDCRCKDTEPLKEPIKDQLRYSEDRCTCGTEWDIDGIPSRKSCKKHNI